jgi:hypothetical protein
MTLRPHLAVGLPLSIGRNYILPARKSECRCNLLVNGSTLNQKHDDGEKGKLHSLCVLTQNIQPVDLFHWLDLVVLHKVKAKDQRMLIFT